MTILEAEKLRSIWPLVRRLGIVTAWHHEERMWGDRSHGETRSKGTETSLTLYTIHPFNNSFCRIRTDPFWGMSVTCWPSRLTSLWCTTLSYQHPGDDLPAQEPLGTTHTSPVQRWRTEWGNLSVFSRLCMEDSSRGVEGSWWRESKTTQILGTILCQTLWKGETCSFLRYMPIISSWILKRFKTRKSWAAKGRNVE